MSTPRMVLKIDENYIRLVISKISDRLLKGSDPKAVAALSCGTSRPVVGVGLSGTEEKPRLEVLAAVPEHEFDFPGLLRYLHFDECPYKVIETGVLNGAAAAMTVSRPALGGDSIQLRDGPVGTLGCMVVDNAHGTPLVLSCNHVIADCNRAEIGTSPILHPARSSNEFGVLHDFETLQFGGPIANTMDAALCRPESLGAASSGLRVKGALAGTVTPPLNAKVYKEGAASGVTDGVLTIRGASMQVNLDAGTAVFENQYAVTGTGGLLGLTRFAKGGDSGAIVIDESNRVLGLLFAVSSRINQAYVNPIDPILERFGITIK